MPVEEKIGLFLEGLAFFNLVKVLVIEMVPEVVLALGVGDVMPATQRAMVHRQGKQAVCRIAANLDVRLAVGRAGLHAEGLHVEDGRIRRHLLYLAEGAVEALDVKDEHTGQFNQVVPHLCFVLLRAGLTCVIIVDLVLCVVVLQALDKAAFVLEGLCHEWVARERLMLALGALDHGLHDA